MGPGYGDMETWKHIYRHGDKNMATWTHGNMDMETYRHGYGDMDMET
jgi:hypothetical protein